MTEWAKVEWKKFNVKRPTEVRPKLRPCKTGKFPLRP